MLQARLDSVLPVRLVQEEVLQVPQGLQALVGVQVMQVLQAIPGQQVLRVYRVLREILVRRVWQELQVRQAHRAILVPLALQVARVLLVWAVQDLQDQVAVLRDRQGLPEVQVPLVQEAVRQARRVLKA